MEMFNTSSVSLLGLNRSTDVTQVEMFHSAMEIRNHIKEARSLCEIYRRNPELLLELSMESLLVGHEVNVVGKGVTEIPPVDSFLFNLLYILTCTDEQAERFQENFPGWDTLYMEEYSDGNPKYSQVMHLLFDILHHQNDNNIWPMHVMLSELIASGKPTELMDCFSRMKKCASPSFYSEFKKRMAALFQSRKESGDVIGLDPNRYAAGHIDNLEQIQK